MPDSDYSITSQLYYRDLAAEVQKTPGVVPFVGAGLSTPHGFPTWKDFLLSLAPDAIKNIVHDLLERGKFEEAAEEIYGALREQEFNDAIGRTFGDRPIIDTETAGAAAYLPDIATGPVITTNFDRVLERAFAAAKHDFSEVVKGIEIDRFVEAVNDNPRYLLKLHGDVNERTGRILRKSEYDRIYDKAEPTLTDVLQQMLGNRTFLFLGCSLKDDRLANILYAAAQFRLARTHYAVVPEPKDSRLRDERVKFLSDRKIRPIWYPEGRYELVPKILAELAALRQPKGIRIRPYTFANEKDIIQAYAPRTGPDPKYETDGCPRTWPIVLNRLDFGVPPDQILDNPLHEDEIGLYRSLTARILVNVSKDADEPEEAFKHEEPLTLLEAGPRKQLVSFGTNSLRVGILVSGGIAPGINSVIHGIVSRHELYSVKTPRQQLEILGFDEGFRALLTPGSRERRLNQRDTQESVNRGGAILKTARVQELLDSNPQQRLFHMQRILNRIYAEGLQILYVIGGDGSMRAAHELNRLAEATIPDLQDRPSIVGVPKTMDNDVLWVWQSFGFLTAVEKATNSIINLHTEVTSNPRLGIVQLFGSDSGFVVSHAALASGVCDLALIPEVPFTMEKVSQYLIDDRLRKRRYPSDQGQQSPWGMVVMAETAIPQDAARYFHDCDDDVGLTPEEQGAIERYFLDGYRVRGQTPDALRSGGLKIVSQVLQQEIHKRADEDPYWAQFRVVTNEPRHLIRSTPPSVADVIFGQRLGTLAVDNAMAGFFNFMVSQWLTEYVLVPLDLVAVGRKRVPQDGIFWKSVLASTGQPARLRDPDPTSEPV